MEKILLVIGLVALLGAGVYMINQESSLTQTNTNEIQTQVFDLYQDWKKKNNRKYSSPQQDQYRLTVFNENYNIIRAFYEGPTQTYTLDFNQFMDITNEEFKANYLGTKPLARTGYAYIPTKQAVNAIDWRDHGVLNEVRNQGQCGSCWAFSTVGALESAHAVAGRGLNAHSEQELVDCSSSYGNAGCNGGWMDQAFQYVIDNGITKRENYAYTARDDQCQRQSGDYRISSFQDVASGNCDDLENAVQGRPIAVAVDANNWQFYSSGVFNNCGQSLDHGVVLVAANDESWTIRNSWAAQWGEAGHIRLAKGNTCGICNVASFPVV